MGFGDCGDTFVTSDTGGKWSGMGKLDKRLVQSVEANRYYDDGTTTEKDIELGVKLALGGNHCELFHAIQSVNFTPEPPKRSRALPMVRSTLPLLRLFTRAKSSSDFPPPA